MRDFVHVTDIALANVAAIERADGLGFTAAIGPSEGITALATDPLRTR